MAAGYRHTTSHFGRDPSVTGRHIDRGRESLQTNCRVAVASEIIHPTDAERWQQGERAILVQVDDDIT